MVFSNLISLIQTDVAGQCAEADIAGKQRWTHVVQLQWALQATHRVCQPPVAPYDSRWTVGAVHCLMEKEGFWQIEALPTLLVENILFIILNLALKSPLVWICLTDFIFFL